MAYNDDKEKKKDKKFNKEAFKHAISMLESSGGKFLSSTTSSAVGKYHFLWNIIKNDPELKGVTKRQFMNNKNLQESIMDRALDGKLDGYPGYVNYAEKLKKEYNTEIPSADIAALTHFLGAGNVRKYLKDPESFKVPGVNKSPEEYMINFDKYFNEHEAKNLKKNIKQDQVNARQIDYSKLKDPSLLEQSKDNTNIPMPVLKKMVEPVENPSQAVYEFNRDNNSNEYNYGGELHSGQDANEVVTLFEGGGSHEQNPLGGIPQGMGANGKQNLVEEGETKWNDYIFSNNIYLDEKINSSKKASNSYNLGGPIDPEPKGPVKTESKVANPFSAKSLLSYLPDNNNKEPLFLPDRGGKVAIQNQREQYIPGQGVLKDAPSGEVNFNQLIDNKHYRNVDGKNVAFQEGNDEAKQFLDRYNHPITRERMSKQIGLTNEDIDNVIIKGLKAKKYKGGNAKGTKAESWTNPQTGEDEIFFGEEHVHDGSIDTHERLHASKVDDKMGKYLQTVLGDANEQTRGRMTRDGSGYVPQSTRNYLNRPGETYGNFAEFREKLGVKPGQKIDLKTMKKLIKDKKIKSNFLDVYDDDKILEALNTVAYQQNDRNNFDNYRLS